MISEPYNTIFVLGPKTGGQSIETAFLDAHDLAWDGRVPLLMRATADHAAGPARLVHLTAPESGNRAVLNDDLKREHDRYGETDFDTFGYSSGFIR